LAATAAVVLATLLLCTAGIVLGLGIYLFDSMEEAVKVAWKGQANSGNKAKASTRGAATEAGGVDKSVPIVEEKSTSPGVKHSSGYPPDGSSLSAKPGGVTGNDHIAPFEKPAPEPKSTARSPRETDLRTYPPRPTEETDLRTYPPRPAEPANLLDLLDHGAVKARIVSVSMNKVSVAITPLEKGLVTVLVPAGTLFKSKNPRFQDLVVVETLKIPVDKIPVDTAVPVTLDLATCCTDVRKSAPAQGLTYGIERLPEDSQLRKLACELADTSKPIQQKQQEVWALTNGVR
jgi:hypothetical protein